MAVLIGYNDYGKLSKIVVLKFFDILKNWILKVEELGLSPNFINIEQYIDFQTHPGKN